MCRLQSKKEILANNDIVKETNVRDFVEMIYFITNENYHKFSALFDIKKLL